MLSFLWDNFKLNVKPDLFCSFRERYWRSFPQQDTVSAGVSVDFVEQRFWSLHAVPDVVFLLFPVGINERFPVSVANAALVSGGMDKLEQSNSFSVGDQIMLTLDCLERRPRGFFRPMVQSSSTWHFHRGSHRQFIVFTAINLRISWYRVSFTVLDMSGSKVWRSFSMRPFTSFASHSARCLP